MRQLEKMLQDYGKQEEMLARLKDQEQELQVIWFVVVGR